MRRPCSLLLLLALAAPVWTITAFAQDDAAVEMARERFQEGVKFYDAKQYAKARAAFLQAYALKKHPAVLLNLAQSELRSGHEAEAAKHFSQYLRENTAASAMERQEADKGLSAAKAHVAELTVQVEAGAGAELLVNGNAEGTVPLPGPIYLKPGNHTVEARRGGQVATQAVSAAAGQSGAITLSFTGGESGGAPVPVGSGPGTPGGPSGGPAGPGDTGGAGFQVGTGGARQPFFEWATENKLAWVGAGLTVIGLAGGIGFAIASGNSYDSADSVADQIRTVAAQRNLEFPCGNPNSGVPPATGFAGPCQTYQDNVELGDSQKTLSIVSFVVAGAAAAGTVIYYFVDTSGGKKEMTEQRKARAPRASVVPVVSPQFSGMALSGSF
jgi:hypothetical protein